MAFSQGDYDVAIDFIEKNIEEYSKHKNDSSELQPLLGLAISYDLLGQIHLFKGNHNIALKHNMEGLLYFEQIDQPIRKADALNHLASIEHYLGNYEKSIEYNLEAVEIYQEYNDKLFAANTLNDIGNAYFDLGNLNQAIEFLEQSLALSEEMYADDLIGTAINNLGRIYTRKGEFEKAITFFSKALDLHEKTNAKNKIIETLNNLGMVHNEMNLPGNAIFYFNRAITMAERIDSKESLKIGYFNRSRSFELQHDYTKALGDYKAYKAIDDSVFNTTKSQQIEELGPFMKQRKKKRKSPCRKMKLNYSNKKIK